MDMDTHPSPVMRGCTYGMALTFAAAFMIVSLVMILSGCVPVQPTHICQRWDLSDTRLATRDSEGFTYQDGNGITRRIGASESDQWRCEELETPAAP